MPPAKLSGHRFELRDGKSRSVKAADQGACRSAGNRVNGYRVFFQRAQYSDVGYASGRAAGKRQADAGTISFPKEISHFSDARLILLLSFVARTSTPFSNY